MSRSIYIEIKIHLGHVIQDITGKKPVADQKLESLLYIAIRVRFRK